MTLRKKCRTVRTTLILNDYENSKKQEFWEVMEPSGREKVAAAAALVAGLVGMWFMLAYSYVYINCAVFPVAGALIAYAYDVAERTVAARKECCRKVETRRAYRAARASEYGA